MKKIFNFIKNIFNFIKKLFGCGEKKDNITTDKVLEDNKSTGNKTSNVKPSNNSTNSTRPTIQNEIIYEEILYVDKDSDTSSDESDSDFIKDVETPVEYFDSINCPINPDNIKYGEIGGYLMYDKTKAIIDETFVQNVKNMGLNILYINTPRKKDNPTTFDEWLEIFDKFKGSGVRIMLYLYEAVSMSPMWSNSQIKTISSHESFYGWIGEDEVSYKSYNSGNSWIKRYHDMKWSNGSRKWNNIAVCFFPKLSNLNSDMIGENYSDYLKLWSDAIDIAHADMYPFKSDNSTLDVYDIDGDGKAIYSKLESGKYWFDYLKEHCKFTNEYPQITHRLYMNSCKHVAKDGNDKLYIARPKPTETPTKIQAYANLMSGSNGLMLFVLNDILSNKSGFSESPFNDKFEKNNDTYNLMMNIFNSDEFVNYKNIIVNLNVSDVVCGSDFKNNNYFIDKTENENLLISTSNNTTYNYCTVLNTSLDETISIEVNANQMIVDLDNLKDKKLNNPEKINLEPGDLILIKSEI
jgi:hypothetical protein